MRARRWTTRSASGFFGGVLSLIFLLPRGSVMLSSPGPFHGPGRRASRVSVDPFVACSGAKAECSMGGWSTWRLWRHGLRVGVARWPGDACACGLEGVRSVVPGWDQSVHTALSPLLAGSLKRVRSKRSLVSGLPGCVLPLELYLGGASCGDLCQPVVRPVARVCGWVGIAVWLVCSTNN